MSGLRGAAGGCGSRVEGSFILICYSRSLPGHRRRKLSVFCLASFYHTGFPSQRLDWSHFCHQESINWKLETCCSFIKTKKISGVSNKQASLLLQTVHTPVKLTGLQKDTACKSLRNLGRCFFGARGAKARGKVLSVNREIPRENFIF